METHQFIRLNSYHPDFSFHDLGKLKSLQSSSKLYIVFPGLSAAKTIDLCNQDYDSDIWVQGSSIGLPFTRPLTAFFLERLCCDRLSISLLFCLINHSYRCHVESVVISSLSLKSNWNLDLIKCLPKTCSVIPTISPALCPKLDPRYSIPFNYQLFDFKSPSFMPKLFSSVVYLPLLAAFIGYKEIVVLGADLNGSGYYYSDVNLPQHKTKSVTIPIMHDFDFRSSNASNSHQSQFRTKQRPYSIIDYLSVLEPYLFDIGASFTRFIP